VALPQTGSATSPLFFKTAVNLMSFSRAALFAALFISMSAFASTVPQAPSTLEELAKSWTWRALLHYSGEKSDVISPEFFLSDQGATDALSELIVDLEAFAAPADQQPDNHAQCQFPARFRWLQSQLDLTHIKQIACPAYAMFSQHEQSRSVSIILATGYLGNPASYYGHLLLKVNSKESQVTSSLLDQTINYGAIVPKNVDPVSYMINGVIGGYDGGFSSTQYYVHNHNYGENEQRDLWEFELNLNESQKMMLVSHSWEMLGKKHKYFFFKKNCAYRMAELIEIAISKDIVPVGNAYTIPQALIQKLSAMKNGEAPLIKSAHYRPSRQSRFYQRFQDLSKSEQNNLKKAIHQIGFFNTSSFTSLANSERRQVLLTVIDYYQYTQKTDSPQYKNALQQLLALPPAKDDFAAIIPTSPSQARLSSMTRFSFTQNPARGKSLSIKIRPAYYDPLDADAGHRKNAELIMAEAEVQLNEDQVEITRFTALSIKSANTDATGLPGDRNFAWKMRLGAERADLECKHCMIARAQGDMGYAIQPHQAISISAYLGGSIQEKHDNYDSGFVRASVAAISHHNRFSARAELEQRYYPENDENTDVYSIDINYRLSKDTSLRLEAEKNQAIESKLGISWYW
jgi:hypothetical protein